MRIGKNDQISPKQFLNNTRNQSVRHTGAELAIGPDKKTQEIRETIPGLLT